MTLTSAEFVEWVLKNAARVRQYKKGGDGTNGDCDCIGLLVGAWRLAGQDWRWAHGSNYAARFLTYNLLIGQSLRAGDLVYKARPPGNTKYALPDRYKKGPDLNDYYHVGVVLCSDPLDIIHCTSVPGGIQHDKTRGAWKYSGQFNQIRDDPMSIYQATLVARSGSTVNLRSGPGLGYNLIARLKIGTTVEVQAAAGDGWSYIKSGKRYGYVQNDFLQAVGQEPAADPAPQGSIRTILDQLDTAQKSIDAAVKYLQSIFPGTE